MKQARAGIHVSVIYDVPERRPVPLPDMICASPTDVTGLTGQLQSRLYKSKQRAHRPVSRRP